MYVSIYLCTCLSGAQRSQSSVGTVMDSYWSNVRSQLDRSTAFIASQSNRRTSNSSRTPSHLRDVPLNQPSDSAEPNSQGTSSLLFMSRSNRETSRSTSNRPFRPTSYWYHSCPFRVSDSSGSNSRNPSFAVPQSSSFGHLPPYSPQGVASSVMHIDDILSGEAEEDLSGEEDVEVHVPLSRDPSSPTRRSEWWRNYTGSRRVAGAPQTVPTAGWNSQSSEVEVIVVDSDDDEEVRVGCGGEEGMMWGERMRR